MFFESCCCSYGYSMSMTCRAFIDVFFHLFSYFLWFERDSLYRLMTVTTIKRDISAFWIEVIFTFFPENRNIDEVEVGRRHGGVWARIYILVYKKEKKSKTKKKAGASHLTRSAPAILYYLRKVTNEWQENELMKKVLPAIIFLSFLTQSGAVLRRASFGHLWLFLVSWPRYGVWDSLYHHDRRASGVTHHGI